ncbi:MAG: hypothetical protein ACM3NQ_11975, partial [Bacteroidales bacterium]
MPRFPGFTLLATLAALSGAFAQSPASWLDGYRQPAKAIIDAATGSDAAWQRLAEMTDTFGPRLSGSPQLNAAIEWAAAEMRRDGLENVHTEPAMVPHWVRGEERAEIVRPVPQTLVMLGLGGSIATPPAGIEAETLVVKSFDDLTAHAAEAKGRIVVFNVPYEGYGRTVVYRSDGA